MNVLKATQLLVGSGCLKEEELLVIVPISEKILRHYVVSGQEIYLEYPLDILRNLAGLCAEEVVDRIWEVAVVLQNHEDVVIRERAEDLIEAFIKLKKISVLGKWEIKSKKGLDNYEQYLKLAGK